MNNKKGLFIIGASGHGRVVADIALKMKKWSKIAFLDDNETLKYTMGIKVVGKTSDAFSYINNDDIFVAIGNNTTRETIQSQLECAGAKIPVLIHPSAVIGQEVELGDGTVIMAGSVINCCSKIGKGCILNTGVTVDHDNEINDYVHISPGSHLAGTVVIGKRSWIGIGTTVSSNISISKDCIVGAGTVVVKDITVIGTYVGIPARRIN